jgi:translocation and assembly module TamA
VLDEKEEEAENFLGKISDSISNIAEKIFPEDEVIIDENFVSPTLANRITPEQVLESKKIPLYVFVYANNPRDAQVGLGFGTDTGVRATARIDYNLLNRQGLSSTAETKYLNKQLLAYGSRPWNILNEKLDARLTWKMLDQGDGGFDLSTRYNGGRAARNIRSESGWNEATLYVIMDG